MGIQPHHDARTGMGERIRRQLEIDRSPGRIENIGYAVIDKQALFATVVGPVKDLGTAVGWQADTGQLKSARCNTGIDASRCRIACRAQFDTLQAGGRVNGAELQGLLIGQLALRTGTGRQLGISDQLICRSVGTRLRRRGRDSRRKDHCRFPTGFVASGHLDFNLHRTTARRIAGQGTRDRIEIQPRWQRRAVGQGRRELDYGSRVSVRKRILRNNVLIALGALAGGIANTLEHKQTLLTSGHFRWRAGSSGIGRNNHSLNRETALRLNAVGRTCGG